MSDLLARLTEHLGEHHKTAAKGFTVYGSMAEHLLLHQYAHGIPPEGSPHDLDHHRISDERVPESEEPR